MQGCEYAATQKSGYGISSIAVVGSQQVARPDSEGTSTNRLVILFLYSVLGLGLWVPTSDTPCISGFGVL